MRPAGSHTPVVVAIPARNEAGSIGAALTALAEQQGGCRRIAATIVHANNCTDDTVAVARAMSLPFPLEVIAAELPPDAAHIGHVRRAVTDAAAAHLLTIGHPEGIVASTDADSCVAPDWLTAMGNAFSHDVDAVCGVIDLAEPVPPGLAAVRQAEADYADMVARMTCHLDPLPHDPWPNHIWSWGANFAVRAATLRVVGGSPLVDLAEDRALHARLLRDDVRIRHSTGVRVRTSARSQGRAPGGFADLLTGYAEDPAALADFNLEPASTSWARAARRGIERRLWGDGPGFGEWWASVEAATDSLARQRVAIRALPAQTAMLRHWLKAATDRSDNPVHGAEGPALRQAPSHR